MSSSDRAALGLFPLVTCRLLLSAPVCNVSNKDEPLTAVVFLFLSFFFILSLLSMDSLESSVSQAAKCIGEQEQGNLELMSFLQEEQRTANMTDCAIYNRIMLRFRILCGQIHTFQTLGPVRKWL